MIVGKGGSGKSSMVAAIAKVALGKGSKVVVVDADESNPGIERMLGLKQSTSTLLNAVGGRRQVFGMLKDAPSETVQNAVRSYMQEAIGKDLFLVRVGKIAEAGSGCACPHGVISREILSYPLPAGTLVLVDAEAGIEHFGRGVDAKADKIVFVADPSYDTMNLCAEARRLADSIGVELYVVLNKIESQDVSTYMTEQLSSRDIDVDIVVPYDRRIFESTLLGKPLEIGVATEAVERLVCRLLS